MAGLETSTRIVQLNVRLLSLSSMIWRRVLVPESVTQRDLHGILQVGMGWDGIHLYYFDIHAVRNGSVKLHVQSPDMPLSRNMAEPWQATLQTVERNEQSLNGRMPAEIHFSKFTISNSSLQDTATSCSQIRRSSTRYESL